MRNDTRIVSKEFIAKLLDKRSDDRYSVRPGQWLVKVNDTMWTAVDNNTYDFRVENFTTEFAARFWLECKWYSAEWIRD